MDLGEDVEQSLTPFSKRKKDFVLKKKAKKAFRFAKEEYSTFFFLRMNFLPLSHSLFVGINNFL